jgi:hypothetical protein
MYILQNKKKAGDTWATSQLQQSTNASMLNSSIQNFSHGDPIQFILSMSLNHHSPSPNPKPPPKQKNNCLSSPNHNLIIRLLTIAEKTYCILSIAYLVCVV